MAVTIGARRPAVFIDKDGTLIHDLPFNVDPERIRLRADAIPALLRLQAAGYALVLVSNQSGVARGLFTEADLQPVWARLLQILGQRGIQVAGIYYCPHHPEGREPRYAIPCDCRKPQPGLLLRAAADHGFDLARSWFIGDILDDVEAGRRAGCRTILLDVGSETEWLPGPWRLPHFIVGSLRLAAGCIVPLPVPAWTA